MDYDDGDDLTAEQVSNDEEQNIEDEGSSIAPHTYSAPASPAADTDMPGSPFRSNPHSPDNNSIADPASPSNPRSPASPSGPASPNDAGGELEADSAHEIESPGISGEINSPDSPASQTGSARGSLLSPAGSIRSRSASPNENIASRSRSNSYANRSRSNSPAASRSRSRSASPAGSRGRSWSASPPRSRSGSGSPVGSRNASPVTGSRLASPTRSTSGSPRASPSGSLHRSRSGSRRGSRSASVSPTHSRSRNPSNSPPPRSRSRSVSSARSRSRSASRARSGSRSAPASPARSGSRSAPASPARSGSRSAPASPARGDDDDDDEVIGRRKRQVADDSDHEGSDKGSEVGELIADIFGSSDEEEFEGFGNAEAEAPPKKDKKKAAVSDDEGADTASVLPELSDDEGKPHAGDFISDFDLMLAKKKEEMSKRRKKRKDIDIINDNDDLIDVLIGRMKTVAEEDRTLNQQRKPAVKKLGLLPKVISQLKKADLQNAFIDGGILSAMTEWLAPLPDKSLPHLQIREAMLKHLLDFPTISNESLKASGIGKAVMYLYKHPREIRQHKDMAQKLINEWSRPIFNLTSDLKNLSREEREQRDYEHLPKKRRISLETGATPRRDIDNALAGDDKVLRPGDPGYVYRARVPQPSVKDYVIRPKWNLEEKQKGSGKKQVSKYEQHLRAHKRKMSAMKQQRAVTMSIEGRNMSI